VALCGYQEFLVQTRVIQVMANSRDDAAENFRRLYVAANHWLLQKPRHGLGNVGSVDSIVVGVGSVVTLLDQSEELPYDKRVEAVVIEQVVHLKKMYA